MAANVPEPVVALFRALPAPGSEWPPPARMAWLRAMNALLALSYPCDGEIIIEPAASAMPLEWSAVKAAAVG